MATGEEPRIILLGLGVSCYNMYRRLSGCKRISFERMDLSGRDLRQANFDNVNLRLVNFRETDLRHASLWGANVSDADFTGADLRGADLFRANCEHVFLWGASLEDAKLGGTNFEGARGLKRQDFERWIGATQSFAGKGYNFHMRLLLQGRSFEEWAEAMGSSIIFDEPV